MHTLIDCDVLRYRVGFACEYTLYHFDEQEFKGIKALKDYAKEKNIKLKEEDLIGEDILDSVENCLHSCKLQVEHILGRTKAKSWQGYLTGKDNFREKIATIKPYKGNRPDRKPKHYDALTEYLVNVWGAQIVDGIEADDALAIDQTERKFKGCCIASIDKDLLQVPGKHYDFYHDKRITISESESERNLYAQIISGDSTDNIQGVPGIGDKGARKLLSKCGSISEFYRVAQEAYHTSIRNKGEFIFNGLGPDDALLETARLVYLLRRKDDEWRPPK